MLYVFKKNASINQNISLVFSKLIRMVFTDGNARLKPGSLKLLNVHVLHYISNERRQLEALKACCRLLLKTNQSVREDGYRKIGSVRGGCTKLFNKLEVYNEINAWRCSTLEHPKYLEVYEKLVKKMEQVISKINLVSSQFDALAKVSFRSKRFFEEVERKVLDCQYDTLYVLNCVNMLQNLK